MKFSLRLRTWDALPAPNFVEIAQGDLPLGENFFYQKFGFQDFVLLKPTFLYP